MADEQQTDWYGWYSIDHANRSGYAIYEDVEGREVPVTCVSRNPSEEDYKWDDKIFVGIVVKFLYSFCTDYNDACDYYEDLITSDNGN